MISAFVPGHICGARRFGRYFVLLCVPVLGQCSGSPSKLISGLAVPTITFDHYSRSLLGNHVLPCRPQASPGEAEGSGPKAGSASEHPSKPRTCLSPRSQTGRSWPEAGFRFSLRTDPAETHGSKEANGQVPQASVRNRRFTVTPK